MSKTLLVAMREYVENLRTKTFWIGILLFPIIIGVTLLVNRVLERSKDQRSYTVLDYSANQWLSEEVGRRSLNKDLGQFLQERAKQTSSAPKTPAELRAAWVKAKQDLPNPKVGPIIDVFLAMPDEDVQQLIDAGADGKPPLHVMQKHLPKLAAAMQQFDAREMGRVFAELSLGRYRRVSLKDLGVELSADREKVEAQLRAKVNRGDLFAFFVINEDPAHADPGTGLPQISGRYVSANVTDADLRRWYAGHAAEVVRERQVAALKLSKEQARALQDDFSFRARTVTSTGSEEDVSAQKLALDWAPMGYVYFLWFAVFSIANMLLTNTVEEKSNRIIEVLLSSVSPHQLMSGKIFGIAATGLTMIGSWVICALIAAQFILDVRWLSVLTDPTYLASFVCYFLSGYLIYAAILVAIGSVCNSLKEAQNLLQPVMLVLMVPVLAMFFVVQDPNGTVSRILTYIPVYTPFLMMNRAGGPPPTWEYVASTLLILVTIVVAFWAAGRVFRVGVLMTGKPPRLREIVGWLLHPPSEATNPRS